MGIAKKKSLCLAQKKMSPLSPKPVIVFQPFALTLTFGATLTSTFRLNVCVCVYPVIQMASIHMAAQRCRTEISHAAEHYANYGSGKKKSVSFW